MPIRTGYTLASANDATVAIDALTDFLAFRYKCLTNSPILKVEWFPTTKTGTPGPFGIVITADNNGVPNISAGVPVDIGGGTPTLKTLAAADVTAAARNTTTFTNGYTPTVGDEIWIVFYPISGTWDASNRYVIRDRFNRWGSEFGNEFTSESVNTGTSWVNNSTGTPTFSLLTTSDAYIPMLSACCITSSTSEDWNDASNPDERGSAFTVPTGVNAILYGFAHLFRTSTTAADFEVKAYLDTTQQGSTFTIDAAKYTAALGIAGAFGIPGTITIGPGTGRLAIHPLDATATIRQTRVDFTTQARRESAMQFMHNWYCHRNAGGAWTDDLVQCVSVLPHFWVSSAGGAGGLRTHPGMAGGMLA